LSASNINFTGVFTQDGVEFQGSPWDSSGNDLTYTTGNVAIGTTSTDHKLTVGGPLRLTDGFSNVIDLSVSTVQPFGGLEDQGVISADTPVVNGFFGKSYGVSGNGNRVIIGAYRENSYTGAIYAFTRSGSTWTQRERFVTDDAAAGDQIGHSAAMSYDGSIAIVGAPYESTKGAGAGAAYIFTRSGESWSQQAKLMASQLAASDTFGFSVSMSSDGNTVIVGAPGIYRGIVAGENAAYIFTRSGSTWTQRQRITGTGTNTFTTTGIDVAMSGDGQTAIIGENHVNVSTRAGRAYVFARSGETWSQQANLSINGSDDFGQSVTISEDGHTVACGAQRRNNADGAVHVYTRSGVTWSLKQTINSPVTGAFHYFGQPTRLSRYGDKLYTAALYGDTFYEHEFIGATWVLKSSIALSVRDIGISGDGGTIFAGHIFNTVDGISLAGSCRVYQLVAPGLNVSADVVTGGSILSFTGQHMCFPEGPIEQGLVVSANKNKFMNLNGTLTTGLNAIKSSESLPIVSLSNVTNDRSVFGVVHDVEQNVNMRRQKYGMSVVRNRKELGDNRVIVNSLGEGAMWIVNTNGNLSSGDYITTSNISGYGQKQDDDILHSYTVAKITMDCNFRPEDIPIQVIKKNENGVNVLDEYQRLQWEDTDKTQKAYGIRYLTVDGDVTDEANSVWTAAYIGCTYHCG
jgi:hypothetical protein